MSKEDFNVDLEEKCLDSVRSSKKYDFDSVAARASFLSGYFEVDFPALSKLFDYIATGVHCDLDDISF